MRLFIAAIPPREVLDALDAFLQPRRDAATFRWADLDNSHVTLAFVPDAEEYLAEPLAEALVDIAPRHDPFDTMIAGGGAFPNPNQANVLWADVTKPPALSAENTLDRWTALSKACRGAVNRVGMRVEGRRFRPHLTLARMDQPHNLAKWVRLFDVLEVGPWKVGELHVVQSHRGRSGQSRYETLSSIPIGPVDKGDRWLRSVREQPGYITRNTRSS